MSKTPPSQFRSVLRAGFTLVEMLVVLAIIAIITMIVAPALQGVLGGSVLTKSGNLVVNMVNQARQLAITKNTMTALVLLGNQGTDRDFQALTVLEYDQTAGWLQYGAWERFTGRVVVDVDDQVNSSFLKHSPQPFPFITKWQQQNPPVQFQGKQVVDGSGYAARIFLPNGSLLNPDQPAQLRLVEGHLEAGHVKYSKPDRQEGSGKSANFYDVAIVGSTGTPKVIRP